MFHLLLGSLHKIEPCELWTNASHYLDITTCLLTYIYVNISWHKTIWFSMPFIFPHLNLEITIQDWPFFDSCDSYCRTPMCNWGMMECNAHHTAYVLQSAWDSTCWVKKFNLHSSFRVGCKQVINSTCQNFAGVFHGTQKKLNEHQIYLFQNGAQNSVYVWLWRSQFVSKGYKDNIFRNLATSLYQHPIMDHYAN
jgi:hypothetical protein